MKSRIKEINQIDLRKLSEMTSPERAFLSFYISSKDSLNQFQKREEAVRNFLSGSSTELEHYDENLKLIKNMIEESSLTNDPHCFFACWAEDFGLACRLPVPVKDVLWVGSGPFIKPLAELIDEYENFLIVTVDNKRSRIIHMITAIEKEEEKIKGDVKNQVKKGGWSQKRYSRRRDNQLLHYTKEINVRLEEILNEKNISRIVLLGSQEAVNELESNLSAQVAEKIAGRKIIDLNSDTNELMDEAFSIYFEEERKSEQRLWEQIKEEYLGGDLAAAGAEDVLLAAMNGRAESVIVNRDAVIKGSRCRDCENIFTGESSECRVCGSKSVFEIDLVNAITRQLELTSAKIDFVDEIPELTKAGGIAALLRY